MDDGITGGTNASIKSFLKCLNAFNGGKEPVGVEVNPGAPNPLHGAIRADGEKTLDELLKVSSSLTSPEERRYESIFKIFKRIVFPEAEAEKLKALSAQKKTASPVADRIKQSLATPQNFKDSIKDDIFASIIGSALVSALAAGAGALLAKGGLITALASKIPGIKNLPGVKAGVEKRKAIKAEKAEKKAQKKAAKGPRKPIPIPRVFKKGRLGIIGRTIERFSKAKPAVAPTKTTPGTTLGSKPRARSGSLKRQKTSPIAAPKTPQASALDKAVKQPKATKTRLRGGGLGMAGTVLTAAALGDVIADDTLTTKGKTKAVTETAGGVAGSLAGAKLGAATGAAIGSLVFGVGAAPGAVIGGILGSLGGYVAGEKVAGAAFTGVAGEEGLTQDPAALLEAKNKLEQERVDKAKEAKFKSAVKIYGEANVERDESGRGYRIKDKEYAMPQAAIKKQLDLSSDASPDYAAYMEFESLKAKQREARDKIMKAISEGEEPSEALQKSKELADLAVEIQKKKLVDIIKAKKETVKPEQKTPEASKVSSASAKSFAISAPPLPSRPEILGTGAIQKVTKEGEPAHIVIDGKKYGEETDQYKAHETYLKQIADWTKVRQKFDDIKVAVTVGLSLNDQQVLLEDFDKSQKEYNAKYNIDTPKSPQAKQIKQASTPRVARHINFRGDPYPASEGSAPLVLTTEQREVFARQYEQKANTLPKVKGPLRKPNKDRQQLLQQAVKLRDEKHYTAYTVVNNKGETRVVVKEAQALKDIKQGVDRVNTNPLPQAPTPQAPTPQAPTPQAKQIQAMTAASPELGQEAGPYLALEGSAPALPGENITLKGSKEFPIPVYTPATVLPANYSMTTAPGKEHVVDKDTGQKYGPDSDVYKAAWRKKEFDEIKHQAGEKRVFNRTSSEDYNEWLRGKLKPWHGGNIPAPLTGKDREQLNTAKLSILKAMNEPLPGVELSPIQEAKQAPTPQAKQVQQAFTPRQEALLKKADEWDLNAKQLRVSASRNKNEGLKSRLNIQADQAEASAAAMRRQAYMGREAILNTKESRGMREGPSILKRGDSINKPNKPESPAVASKKTGYYSKVAIDPQRKDIAPNIYTKTHNTFQASQQPRQDKPGFYSPYLGRRELPGMVAQPRSEKRIEKPVLEKQGMQADAGISSMSGLINKHYTDIKNINEKLFGAAVEQIELLRVIASNTAGGNSKAAPTIITQGKSGGDAYTRTLNIRNDFLTS